MNVTNFNDKACEKIRRFFDPYLDNELLVETNQEVLRHLASCADCAQILDDRARLKNAVKRAVSQERAPAVLLESIQQTIRQTGRRSFFASDLGRRMMTAAAVLLLAVGGVVVLRSSTLFRPILTNSRDAFQVISAQAQEIMRVGLIDHVHCTLLSKKWKQMISFEHMQEQEGRSALGPEFIGLVPLVQEKIGANFQIVQGHRCVANHRQYVHVILTGQSGAILSLVITEKKGEAFTEADIAATLKASGISLYSASQGQLQIAGFETNRYLAYIVSNLDRDSNMNVASSLAPSVSEYLQRL